MTTILNTIRFIQAAHGDQMYGDKPYWTHPVNVANIGTLHDLNFDEDCYIAALLHDIVEDTNYTLEDLLSMGYSESVVEAVSYVTKNPDITYQENIDNIIRGGSVTAMRVKYFDNYVNFLGDKSDWTQERREHSQRKYAKSLNKIGTALANVDPNWSNKVSTDGY